MDCTDFEILVIGVFLFMFFGEGFDPTKVKPNERVMLLFDPFGFMFGRILGRWKEGLSSAITIVSFFRAMLVGDYNISGAGYMAICAMPGFLFLFACFFSSPALMSKDKPASEQKPPKSPNNEKL